MGGLFRAHSPFEVALDILDHDDGVVDDDATANTRPNSDKLFKEMPSA